MDWFDTLNDIHVLINFLSKGIDDLNVESIIAIEGGNNDG